MVDENSLCQHPQTSQFLRSDSSMVDENNFTLAELLVDLLRSDSSMVDENLLNIYLICFQFSVQIPLWSMKTLRFPERI